jgi:hypothetical protein
MLLLNFIDTHVVNQGVPNMHLSMALGSFAAAVAQVHCQHTSTSHECGFVV